MIWRRQPKKFLDLIHKMIASTEVYSSNNVPKVATQGGAQDTNENRLTIFDFRRKHGSLLDYNFQTIGDRVMGGNSESFLELSESNEYLRFYGTVSKSNGGGFSSFRIVPTCSKSLHDALKDIKSVVIEVKALLPTNRRFKFQLVDGGRVRSNWQSEFNIENDGFQHIELPLASFWPTMFGRVISSTPGNIDTEMVVSLGIMVSRFAVDRKENIDFNEGEFDLAVRSIGVIKDK